MCLCIRMGSRKKDSTHEIIDILLYKGADIQKSSETDRLKLVVLHFQTVFQSISSRLAERGREKEKRYDRREKMHVCTYVCIVRLPGLFELVLADLG